MRSYIEFSSIDAPDAFPYVLLTWGKFVPDKPNEILDVELYNKKLKSVAYLTDNDNYNDVKQAAKLAVDTITFLFNKTTDGSLYTDTLKCIIANSGRSSAVLDLENKQLELNDPDYVLVKGHGNNSVTCRRMSLLGELLSKITLLRANTDDDLKNNEGKVNGLLHEYLVDNLVINDSPTDAVNFMCDYKHFHEPGKVVTPVGDVYFKISKRNKESTTTVYKILIFIPNLSDAQDKEKTASVDINFYELHNHEVMVESVAYTSVSGDLSYVIGQLMVTCNKTLETLLRRMHLDKIPNANPASCSKFIKDKMNVLDTLNNLYEKHLPHEDDVTCEDED